MEADELSLIGIQLPLSQRAKACALADQLDVGITLVPLWWDRVERRDGSLTWTQGEHWRALSRTVARPPVPIWALYPIHMDGRDNMPRSLKRLSLDSPQIAERFESFVAGASKAAGWTDGSPIVLIGNEVDSYTNAHPDEADATISFLQQAADIVHRYAPSAR